MQSIKGGVILIGSLLWEDESNAVKKSQGKMRENWRNNNLDIYGKSSVNLPIRYGRASSSRRCTYTMVFSSTVLDKLGQALVVPYKKDINFSEYSQFKRQALALSEAEGICNETNKKLRVDWGCISIYVNEKSDFRETVVEYWNRLRQSDIKYTKSTETYKYPLDGSLLDENYIYKNEIATDLDFLFFTVIKPEHRNAKEQRFPSPKEIATEINSSAYIDYYYNNVTNLIRTNDDLDILSDIDKTKFKDEADLIKTYLTKVVN
jgi:hypothetical protein